MTQSCGCHRSSGAKNKAGLYLTLLSVDKAITSGPRGDVADGWTPALGAGLFLTLAACNTGANFCVLLLSVMEIMILVLE